MADPSPQKGNRLKRKGPVHAKALLTSRESTRAKKRSLYNLGSGSWLAWANER